MALQDFIQSLQEQDVVYSTPPQPSIRVIPPENQYVKIIPPESIVTQPAPKVIKLNLKQKPQEVVQQPIQQQVVQQPVQQVLQQPVQQVVQQTVQQPTQQIVQPVQQEVVQQVVQQPIQQQTVQQPVQQIVQPVQKQPILKTPNSSSNVVVQQTQEVIPTYTPKPVEQPKPVVQQKVELTDDEIFNNTGTEYSKKAYWMDYYNKAKSSRKSNPIVDRMKLGRFTITPDNKVLLLPDYDIVGKDPDDVLKDKWF